MIHVMRHPLIRLTDLEPCVEAPPLVTVLHHWYRMGGKDFPLPYVQFPTVGYDPLPSLPLVRHT